MNKKYSGFTLVEMLIVMGIIIILTVIGITAGRFAINRANDVAHRNAVDQVYTSLQAYYTDNRKYPVKNLEAYSCTGTICTLKELVGDQETEGFLVPYIDAYSFDGGTTATYFYGVGGEAGDQAVLVCVTLRGDAAENYKHPEGIVYCAGNGIGVVDMAFENGETATIPEREMTYGKYSTNEEVWGTFAEGGSTWNGDTWGTEAEPEPEPEP